MNKHFDMLPSALRRQGELARLGEVPSLLIRPETIIKTPPPLLLWLHGRTAYKELDPGRYLRLMRAGIAVCAIDLPGHGEREDPDRQTPEAVLDIVLQASEELDAVCHEAACVLDADPTRIAIGGMSAGGMAAIHRATTPHTYAALTLEATSGAWSHLPMATHSPPDLRGRVETADPIRNLADWRPIPVLAVHARYDTWIPQDEQWKFLDAIESLGDPAQIRRVRYDRTGADAEHAGFGRHSADAKEQQCRFLTECLFAGAPTHDI